MLTVLTLWLIAQITYPLVDERFIALMRLALLLIALSQDISLILWLWR